jgi:hypothetical protein
MVTYHDDMLRLLFVAVTLAGLTLSVAACERRVVGRSGIGDPNLGQHEQHRSNPDDFRRKWDDGEHQQQP